MKSESVVKAFDEELSQTPKVMDADRSWWPHNRGLEQNAAMCGEFHCCEYQ